MLTISEICPRRPAPAEHDLRPLAFLNYIEPREPNQNAYIERFNRTFRTEVLDA